MVAYLMNHKVVTYRCFNTNDMIFNLPTRYLSNINFAIHNKVLLTLY